MTEKKKDRYRETLHLPKTGFSMRAGLIRKEPEFQKRWVDMDLGSAIRKAPHPAGDFVFHDGPPYANGSIHLGHLLNKILKDLVVRSRLMAGYDVDFVPGWDCHGLPIEHKVMQELGGEAQGLSTVEIRERCADYASRFMALQAEQMQRLGTLGSYDRPYFTMDPAYEGAVLEVFAALVMDGLVYRDLKPVHWSIENQTALAEAELEYYDRKDTSVFVFFDVEDPSTLPQGLQMPEGETAHLMIWTTTPWTLPANLAVAVSATAEYGLYRTDHEGRSTVVVMAENLSEKVLGPDVELLGRCRGADLIEGGVRYRHPFIEQISPVVVADYVTLEDGTGMVHTAPGHGAEDYMTGLKEGLDIYCPVLGDGTFDQTAPEWLQGKSVWAGNPLVVERLRSSGHLFRDEGFNHSYPHDWRGKTPTIFRATEQFFVAVDNPFGEAGKSLRQRAEASTASQIEFVPEWGRKRFRGMIESRPDWCISRQRSWGLPIPAFLTVDGEVLLTEKSVRAVAAQVRAHGSNLWFSSSTEVILAGYDPTTDSDAPASVQAAGKEGLNRLEKGADIFDVWFESGSSWNGVLKERGIGYPADLYLEGSDQHRGWFQLSLLLGLGATGRSPFKTVLTHGFIVTGSGEKMSKSLGNTIEVEDLLKQHGADIARWWVASLNYFNDAKVEWEFFRLASEEYRKVRNTIRFMLGNLADFDPDSDRVAFGPEDSQTLDAWAMGRVAELIREVNDAYLGFQFKKVREALFNFCNDTMSAVYMAAVKDRLYCDRANSKNRRRTQTVLYEAASALIRLMAPILVHTADEAWLALHGDEQDSERCVHLETLPEAPEVVIDAAWAGVFEMRSEVLRAFEQAKESMEISNPMDAGARVVLEAGQRSAIEPFVAELVDLCGMSRFELVDGDHLAVEILDLRSEPRCERSWKRDGTVRERSDGGMLSQRDADVVGVD